MTEHDGVRTESATDELRRMLDERGVKWGASDTCRLFVTSWNDANGHSWAFVEHKDGSFSKLTAYHLTPEQAIAATLGAGTCHVECFDDGIDEALDGSPIYTTPTWHLSCGHTEQGSERPNFCPVCGKAVVA